MKDYSWSYSAYSSALRCLKEFDYTYIQKIPEAATDSDLRFGTALHGALNETISGGDGKEFFKVFWGFCVWSQILIALQGTPHSQSVGWR